MEHSDIIMYFCRLCGTIAGSKFLSVEMFRKSGWKKKNSADCKYIFNNIYGIDIEHDDVNIHPLMYVLTAKNTFLNFLILLTITAMVV